MKSYNYFSLKKPLIIIVILFLPLCLFGQSNRQNDYFALSFQAGYLKPLNSSDGKTKYGGFELRPSVEYKISKAAAILFEYNYGRNKYSDSDGNTGYINDSFLGLGFRLYPKTEEKFYFKPVITLPVNTGANDYQPIPGLNLGIGNDFRINNNVDLFGEAELFLSVMGGNIRFSFSAGIKYKIFE